MVTTQAKAQYLPSLPTGPSIATWLCPKLLRVPKHLEGRTPSGRPADRQIQQTSRKCGRPTGTCVSICVYAQVGKPPHPPNHRTCCFRSLVNIERSARLAWLCAENTLTTWGIPSHRHSTLKSWMSPAVLASQTQTALSENATKSFHLQKSTIITFFKWKTIRGLSFQPLWNKEEEDNTEVATCGCR